MNAIGDMVPKRRWAESARWAACFTLAVAFHGAAAAGLLARWNDDDLVANAPVITIELAALPVAPETTPNEIPPGPQQQEAEPEPEPEKPLEKQLELPPDPKAEPIQAVTPPPPKVVEKPREKKPKQKHASLASAPSSAETKSERAAAPMPGANSRNPNAVPNWKSQLVAQLERNKRYPSEAQSRGEQGIAQLGFSVDRSGGVHNARILRSSGSNLLDQATLALVARAAPLPPPPPEVAGSQIPISVPIRYNVR